MPNAGEVSVRNILLSLRKGLRVTNASGSKIP